MFDLLRKAGTLISKIIVQEKIYLRIQEEIRVAHFITRKESIRCETSSTWCSGTGCVGMRW